MDPILPLEIPGDYSSRLSGFGVAGSPIRRQHFRPTLGFWKRPEADSCVLVISPDALNLDQGFNPSTRFERKDIDDSE